jgi:hypothetical protein
MLYILRGEPMRSLRPFGLAAVGLLLIAFGLYAIDRGLTEIVGLYVVAGALGMAALLGRIWT